MDGIKYQYTWFWNVDTGEYAIRRVTEEAKERNKFYFDTFEDAKNDIILDLTDCVSYAFDEIEMLSKEIFSLGKKIQKANDITTWTESE